MSRENIRTKGIRLLTEGRLEVTFVDKHSASVITATCRGDSGVRYLLGSDGNDWYCACEARGRCSHLVALQLVVMAPPPRGGVLPTGPTEEVQPF